MAEWLRKMMAGRYGNDALNFALMIMFLLLAMIGELTNVMPIRWLSLIPLGWCLFRTLSRNRIKRSEENRRFLSMVRPAEDRVRRTIRHLKDSKTHRFFRCPQCSQKLRVPKGKGRIEITCPKCRQVMIRKT